MSTHNMFVMEEREKKDSCTLVTTIQKSLRKLINSQRFDRVMNEKTVMSSVKSMSHMDYYRSQHLK